MFVFMAWSRMGERHSGVSGNPTSAPAVADDIAVWTQQYDASLSDLFGVQADIAYQIAGALSVALEARERRMVEARPTADTEAYLAYLRGITAFRQGWTDTSNQAQARAD